jgi:cytochrome c oxidase cbb3-type subunit I/II
VAGVVLALINMIMTWRARPASYAVTSVRAAPLARDEVLPEPRPVVPAYPTMLRFGYTLRFFAEAAWHRVWERKPLRLTLWVTAAVGVASLFEILPTFLISENLPTIASVQPYTPLELLGRDIYVAEGCYNCHSQQVRPIRAETERYGEYSKPGEFVYDHPFQWGSRRIGPDLHRVGGKYPHLWHVRHMQDPASITPGSIMPSYAWMLDADADFASVQARVDAMLMLGVPYGNLIDRAESVAREQAHQIGQEIVAQGGPEGLEGKQIVALTAYLQRLGTDLFKAPPGQETAPGAVVAQQNDAPNAEEAPHAAQ